MIVKNNNNIRILINDKKAYENYVNVTFDLTNEVSNFDLEIFSNYFSSFVQFSIIEDMLKYENKMEQTIDISSLRISDVIYSNRRTKKIRLNFSFLDYKIKENSQRIIAIIEKVFNYNEGKKLVDDLVFSIENQRTKTRNTSESELAQLEAKWAAINTQNNKSEIISSQMHNLLIDENVKVEELFKLFVTAYRNIFTNVSKTDITITGQDKVISNAIINEVNNLNFVTNSQMPLFDFNANINEVADFKVKADTAKTLRFVGIENSNKKQEYFNSKLLKERLVFFYLNKIRGEYNLIYSPVIMTFISPNTMYCLEHQVQQSNLEVMLEKENEFYNEVLNSKITTNELEKIKLQLQKDVYMWIENGSEDALVALIELFEDSKLDGEYTLENLSTKIFELIENIDETYFKVEDFKHLTNYVVEVK